MGKARVANTKKAQRVKRNFSKKINRFHHIKFKDFCSKDTTGKVNMAEKNDLQCLESTRIVPGIHKEL